MLFCSQPTFTIFRGLVVQGSAINRDVAGRGNGGLMIPDMTRAFTIIYFSWYRHGFFGANRC